MAIRLHKKEEGPQPTMPSERPRVSRTRGFPRFVLFLVIAVAVVLGVYYALTWNKIQVRGIVIAEDSVFITEARCRITRVSAAVGKEVKAGQVLLVSESIDPRSQIQTYQAALEQAQLRLRLATGGGDVGVVDLTKRPRRLTDARQNVAVAEAKLGAAEKSEAEYRDLVKAIAAGRTMEIEKATVDKKTAAEKLVQARASEREVAVELDQALRNYGRAKRLRELDAITVNDFEIAQTKYHLFKATAEKARSATREAQESFDGIDEVLKAVTEKYDAELAAQESRYKRAQAETDVARAFLKYARDNLKAAAEEYGKLDPDFARMQQDEMDYLKQQVEEAKGNLRYYKALAGTIEFRAPFDGIVSELNKQEGDVAQREEKVISVYNPNTVAVEVYIPEKKIFRVEPGQRAYVKLRGTRRSFWGEVVNVNASPERLPGQLKVPTQPERAHDLYYYCRVEVPPEAQKTASPAMRADVTIYTD